MKDPFKDVNKYIWLYDDTFFDFFPTKQHEEIKKVCERYIKKTKPKIIKSD